MQSNKQVPRAIHLGVSRAQGHLLFLSCEVEGRLNALQHVTSLMSDLGKVQAALEETQQYARILEGLEGSHPTGGDVFLKGRIAGYQEAIEIIRRFDGASETESVNRPPNVGIASD